MWVIMFRSTILSALIVCPILLSATHALPSTFLHADVRPLTASQHERFALLRRLIERKAWPEVACQVKVGAQSRELTLQDLATLSNRYPGTPFALAIEGTKNILSLHEKTGLSLKVTFPIVLFAETALDQEILKGKYYWPSHRFGRELQYDNETQRFFIHLGTKGVKPIGKGRKKVVTKTILYHRSHPEVMARAVSEWNIASEFTAMSRLQRAPCVLHAEALMTHKDPSSKKTFMTIVTPIFRPGSLQSVLDNHSIRLTLKERLVIACDIITGLAAMHYEYFVHRDLGARNYFVHIKGSKPNHRHINAVVADLGRALPLIYAHKVPVQGNCCYLPPEGFFRSKMMPWHYFDTDVFALGCVMWQLLYNDMPAWGKKRFFRQEDMSLKKRHANHVALLKRTRARPLKYLRAKQEKRVPLTVRDRFLALILRMTDPEPLNRGKAKDLRNEFLTLLNEEK
jgi:serine/threonine protein kinase